MEMPQHLGCINKRARNRLFTVLCGNRPACRASARYALTAIALSHTLSATKHFPFIDPEFEFVVFATRDSYTRDRQ